MELSNRKLLVIIPAFNEEASIQQVIRDVQAQIPQADIVVVNDGSTDLTGELAEKMDVHVLHLPFNLGIGGAVQTGYLFAQQNRYHLTVQIDGDGQHLPSEIAKLVETMDSHNLDMVIGSRFKTDMGYKPSWSRKIGIAILAKLIGFFVGQPVTDTTSGFRLCGERVIALFAEYYPTDYPEVETIILLSRYGFRFEEVPVQMKMRLSGKSSITARRS
ncbi:MAG: glycosyl transferase family 2, partial [Paenibacillus sp. RIFOXYA1_FULL_44_5]